MMRRYPVRSVLSERKMFSNGGMLPTSKPIESSMNQPSGILASSSPLIDAVSQEILAPMTGGAMPMAQGGVARFRNGGTIGLGQAPDADGGGPYSMDQIKNLLSLINPADRASYVQELASRGLIKDVKTPTAGQPGDVIAGSESSRVDPRIAERLIELGETREIIQDPELPEGGPSSASVDDDLSSLLPDADRPTFQEELAAKKRSKNLNTPTVAETVIETAPSPVDLSFLDPSASVKMFDPIYGQSDLPESGGTPPSGSSEVDALTRKRMSGLAETSRFLGDTDLPESGADQPLGEGALERLTKKRLKRLAETQENIRQGTIPTEETGEISGDPSLTVDEQLELGEGPDDKGPIFDFEPKERERTIDEDLEVLAGDQGFVPTEELPEAQSARDPNLDVDIGIGVDDEEKDVAVSEAAAKNEEAVRKVENRLLSSASDEGRAGKAPGDDPTFDPEAPELSNRITPFDKTDMSEKEAVKTIADYKKLFMDEMPEYEGMSESEKGFALMEAGLRVAAGESANAITNVAKGLKGLGAQFAKDEKEKRAWNRQVELSASKYGLQRIAQDEARIQSLAKEKRTLFNKVFVVRKGQSVEYNGKKYNSGDRIIPSVGSLQDGTFPIGSVSSEAFSIEQLKSDRARLKAETDALFKKVEPPAKFVKSQTDYINAATQIKANIAISNILKEAVVPLQAGKVTGGLNALKAFAKRVENFTGVSIPYADETPDAYRDKVGRAITANITSLLNEGNRTVSDADRDRAEEIGGLYANTLLAPSTKSITLLTEKLRAFEESVQRNNGSNISIMSGIENAWNGSLNNALEDYGDILRKSRGDLSQTARRATPGSRRTVSWKDIISVDPKNPSTLTFKPNWFQGK